MAPTAALCTLAAVATAGCGDDTSFRAASFRLVGPPVPGADNRCPKLFEPTAANLPGADRVRVTYRRAEGGPLLCDVVLPTAGGNRVIAIPEIADMGGRVDLYVEVFGDLGAGPVLLGRGQKLDALLSSTSALDIKLTPTDQFSCSHTQPTVARAFHTVTTLPGGELLIAGGVAARPASGDDVIDPASATGDLYAIGELELYDPVRSESLRLGTPITARTMHSAVLLSTDPVRIALVGGLTVNGDPEALPVLRGGADTEPFRLMPGATAIAAPTEIITYDPTRRTATSQLVDEVVTRGLMAAASPDGALGAAPLLVVGGWTDATAATPSLSYEVIDRVSAARVGTAALAAARVGASVTGLGADSALVWGGDLAPVVDAAVAHGELLVGLDGAPSTAALAVAGGSAQPTLRSFHRAVALGGNRVMVAGGFTVTAGTARDPEAQLAQLIDVSGGSITVTNLVTGAGPATPVGYTEATPLGGGNVLMSGGNPPAGHPGCTLEATGLACATSQALLYRADASSFEPTGDLVVARYGHRAAALPDGRIAIVGGLHAGASLEVIADAELYDPRSADDDPLADLRPAVVRAAGDVARDATTLDPVAECAIIER